MKQFEQLGFQRTMYDKSDLRASARKVNPKITFSNNTFRKTWDRLEVEIRAGESGTDLKVTPSTAAEYFGQIGPYYNQLKTSDEATQTAAAVQQACRVATPAAEPSGPAPEPAPAAPPAPTAPQPTPVQPPTTPAPTPPPQQ